jgi:hypothetical protein
MAAVDHVMIDVLGLDIRQIIARDAEASDAPARSAGCN